MTDNNNSGLHIVYIYGSLISLYVLNGGALRSDKATADMVMAYRMSVLTIDKL